MRGWGREGRVFAAAAAAWLLGAGAGPGARAQEAGLSATQVAQVRASAESIAGGLGHLSGPERRRIVSDYVLNQVAVAAGLPGGDTNLLSGPQRRLAGRLADQVLGGGPMPAPSTGPIPGPAPAPPPSPVPTPQAYVVIPSSPLVYYYAFTPAPTFVYVDLPAFTPAWPSAGFVGGTVATTPVYVLVPR